MYRVLVVDDDNTCIRVATAMLKKFNYQVMAVTCALQALSILAETSDNGEKTTFDMVLADLHMPVMDGFELVRHIHRDFNIPVLLTSADYRTETMCHGLQIGAPAFYLKPLKAQDVLNMWQFSELWKNRKRDACRLTTQANIPKSICTSSSTDEVKRSEKKTKKPVWTKILHSRFVEAMLILGSRRSVPKNILKIMNAGPLTREQVGSHLQKFRKFLQKIFDGKISLGKTSNEWIDDNYHSSIVGGNPNRILVKKLFEERATGYWSDPIPASLPLPPITVAEASSGRSRKCAIPRRPKNGASTSGTTARTTLGHGTATRMDYPNEFIPKQPFNVGSKGNNHLLSGTNFNPGLQFESVQPDPSIGSSSFVANEFGNAFAVPGNEQAPQLNRGVGMADNAGVYNVPAAADNQGEDWGDLWTWTLDFARGQAESSHGKNN